MAACKAASPQSAVLPPRHRGFPWVLKPDPYRETSVFKLKKKVSWNEAARSCGAWRFFRVLNTVLELTESQAGCQNWCWF
ncbi:uncharacterized [Tachysurus ichikawai]